MLLCLLVNSLIAYVRMLDGVEISETPNGACFNFTTNRPGYFTRRFTPAGFLRPLRLAADGILSFRAIHGIENAKSCLVERSRSAEVKTFWRGRSSRQRASHIRYRRRRVQLNRVYSFTVEIVIRIFVES